MVVEKESEISGKLNKMEIPITQDQLTAISVGCAIDEIAPGLTDDQKEFLMTGITSEEWDDAFRELDDSDDESESGGMRCRFDPDDPDKLIPDDDAPAF